MVEIEPGRSALSESVSAVVLKLADEELMVGHILTSVAGWGPELEVNLVLSSAGQEELGHARLFYGLLYGDDSDAINAAIYDRGTSEFTSCGFAERYVEDWAELVVKQYLYDTADEHRLTVLEAIGVDTAIIDRVQSEERFQREFWSYWFTRIAEADAATKERIQDAITTLWPSSSELFQVENGSAEVTSALTGARNAWETSVRIRCDELGIQLPEGESTSNSDGRERIMSELHSVYDLAPGRW
ncbi:hypothetical protein EEB14_44705 [Rhodococcus sp. WS4]|nr:hypothetical protein EEB14_44705 [Rhodococcus sp. WS4]